MKISYQNIYEKEIPEQEITVENGYYKVFKNDQNEIIRKEFYSKNKLFHTYFYIDLGSSHQDVLTSNNQESIVIIEIEKINKNYFKHYLFGYNNSVLKNTDFSIYDNRGYCLLVQDLDIETNLPLYNETLKFYDSNGYEFVFEYFKGTLSSIDVSNKAINFFERYRSDELSLIPNFEWWSQYSYYYLNAEPAIPDEDIMIYES